MRSVFEEQLGQLDRMLVEMGALCETAIAASIQALKYQDADLAKKAIDFDSEVDRKEKDIEALCLKLLLQQQPVARDLRLISSALKMITDMERIGDQAADISEISLMLQKPFIKKLEHIPQMAEEAVGMVNDAIDAFVKKDPALADEVIARDDIVDALFDTVKNDLIQLIMQNGENGEQAIDLIMVAKYLERIGDHAVNIAEWVKYSITGERSMEQD